MLAKISRSVSHHNIAIVPDVRRKDAKDVHNHVHRTGGVATEKQAALDILLIKQ